MFDEFHYIPVSPVVLPFHVTREFSAMHSLEDVVDETNNGMELSGNNARMGATEKTLEGGFKLGTSLFSDLLFDSKRAVVVYGKKIKKHVDDFRKGAKHIDKKDTEELHRLFGTEEHVRAATHNDVDQLIRNHCYFNSYIMALAMDTICDVLGVQKPVVFSRKTCYAFRDIMSKLPRIGGRQLDNWGKGISSQNKQTMLGECDSFSLGKLRGRLLNHFIELREKGQAAERKYEAPSVKRPKIEVELETRPWICKKYPYYRCEYAEACDNMEQASKPYCIDDFVKNRFTRADVEKLVQQLGLEADVDELFDDLRFKRIKVKGASRAANEEELLRQDCFDEGYSFGNIELDRKMLNSCPDFDIYLFLGGRIHTRSWIEFRGKKRLKPLPVADRDSAYQIRGSEFANKCHIARLISKMDNSKFPKHVLENRYAVVGTTRHKMANQRPWLEYMGRGEMHMAQYCEKQVVYRHETGITVKGHSDSFFTLLGPEGCDLFIADYKRAKKGAYEKPAYILQLLLYAKGAEQALGRKFEGYVLNLIKRFFHGQPGEDNFPEYSLIYVPAGGESEISLNEFTLNKGRVTQSRLYGIDDLLMSSYEIQKMLLESKEFFFEYASKMAHKRQCRNTDAMPDFQDCFCVEECKMLKQAMRDNEDLRKYFLEGVDMSITP
ncbi:hypothetical protein KY311_04955, partial [Candidatus Woesearchaeota archaeon]|nr:hypothetical protein [Candidatus Woesearchaeota archaeon]